MTRINIKKSVLFLLTVLMTAVISLPVLADNTVGTNEGISEHSKASGILSYEDYISAYRDTEYGNTVLLTAKDASDFSENSGVKIKDSRESVIIQDNGYAEWSFAAEKDCAYVINVTYMPDTSASGNIELGLKINGKIPFSQASALSFRRIYEQPKGDFRTNSSGNEIKPQSTELLSFKTASLSDASGYVTEPFVFIFSKGVNTIRFDGSRGSIAICEIELTGYHSLPDYKEYSALFRDKKDSYGKKGAVMEGEKNRYTSSVTILPSTDRSSPITYPQSSSKLLLNTIGGTSWKNIGETVIWEFEVEESGWYSIAIRYKQSISDGIFTSRRLYIDGETPFSEAGKLRFKYNSDWQCEKLSDGVTEYKFYLEGGKHTLALEAVAGDAADIISSVDTALAELNRIYRRIVMITGASADVYRDYDFDGLIPNEIESMAKIGAELKKQVEYIDRQAGATGSYTSVLKKLVFQLEKMSGDPKVIAKHLDQFKSNLGALSTWLLTAIEQPLQIDRIFVFSSEKEAPAADGGFFEKIGFSFRCFLASYVTDYSSVGAMTDDNNSNKRLSVWIQSGRDQGEIIREQIDNSFADKYNASVDLKIVPGGTLLKSVLSGISPDVVLDNAGTEPVDYALRGAVVDLTQFPDYKEVAGNFPEAAIKPATLYDKVYGMPQTFDYYMFFYRTDIFEEYGYTVPETWDDLRELIPSLQRNGMEAAIAHDLAMYAALLYQNGGELYRDDGRVTALDSNTAVDTFVDFCELFTLYDCPVTFDFANRFRSGEVPCGIQMYSMYNQLTAFAPEIKGMWKMALLPEPGMKGEKVDHTSVGNGTYIMMLETCKNKELAWSFMKWFMSAEVQSRYALRMESILGSCAKVTSANTQALTRMSWSSSEIQALLGQLDTVDSVPQYPGGYYLSRVLTFAFNRSYNSSDTENMGEDPAEVLGEYIKELNAELERKREEFSMK